MNEELDLHDDCEEQLFFRELTAEEVQLVGGGMKEFRNG